MFNFDLKTAKIYQALRWGRSPIFRWSRPLRKLFLVLFIFAFILFILRFLSESESSSAKFPFGLSIIFLVLTLFFWLINVFLNSKLKKPKPETELKEAILKPEVYNLAGFLDLEAAEAAWQSINFSKKKGLSKISSEALLYFSLKERPEINFIFYRALLNLEKIKRDLKDYLDSLKNEGFREVFSPDFQNVILEAMKIAQKRDRNFIKTEDVIISQSKIDPTFKEYLIAGGIKPADLENLAWWLESLEKRIKERKRFWEWKNLIRKGSIGKGWAAGYTITLDRFSTDLSEILKRQGFPEVVGYKREIEATERILTRREVNNVLIVGESGSGRRSIITALAERSILGESFPEVNFKRVLQLDISSLAAQVGSKEEAETILDTMFQEMLSAGNIILVIDEFHNFIGAKGKPGIIDISGVLGPYLQLPQFKIVALTNFIGLHRYIEQNQSILSLFEKVEVSEISEEETIMLLENLALQLEVKHKKFISYPTLREIIRSCSKYLPAAPFPEKAIELLDEAIIYLKQTKEKVLLPKHIAKLVTEKTKIPVGELEIRERETLINLESLIHQRIIDQEEAVKEVSAALRRARVEVTVRNGPMGCFLFLGPTGVGKTETSKALAEIYFGSEDRMIRLDMSEFQNVGDIPRLIGSAGEEGLLTTKVREAPFSLILLDEIEKAHPNVLNLFLQVLDEGHLTDGLGRKVDFKNAIIIATSNAGYQIILEAIKKNESMPEIKGELLDFLFKEGTFRPEFINRFDGVVVFKSLSKENLLDIAELLLQKLKKNLREKEIEFVITGPLKKKIVELGYDPTFGARAMRRAIQDKIENVLASAILAGELKRGDKVEINPADFSPKIS